MADIQTSFHPIHFAARLPDGEVRIFIWKCLDESLVTLKTLVPNLRPFITADHVRSLAFLDFNEFFKGLSDDEFSSLWFAKTVFDPGLYLPFNLGEPYDADGAANHAKRLAAGMSVPVTDLRSQWSRYVHDAVVDKRAVNIPKHRSAKQELIIEAKPCQDCGVPPVGLVFRHAPPNWLLYCPCCDKATNPYEGWDRESVVEIWNEKN